MTFRASRRTRSAAAYLAGFLAGLLPMLFAIPASAADQQKVADQIEARNKAAIAAYSAGNLDKMKSQLAKAISMGEEAGLDKNPALARAYLLTGVLEVDGNENRDAGVRNFVKALRIAPDIQIPGGMSTSAVVAAFKQARADAAAEPPADDAPKAAPADKRRGEAEAREKETRDREADAQSEAAKREAKEDRDRQAKDLARVRDSEAKERSEKERLQAEKERLQKDRAERDRALAEAKAEREKVIAEAKAHGQELEREKAEHDKRMEREKADLDKQVADGKEREKKEREAKDKLLTDKQDRDRQLAEAKTRIQQLEKDKADRDKQIADGKEREKKEREAKDKLLTDKQDRDRQLAEAKTRIQQLEKDKADRDKQIADGKEREKKEREAKDRAEHAYQWAQGRDKERKAKEDQERAEHDKQVDGPDLPGRIPEPLYCTVPDEAPSGADLYVHCVPQPAFRPKVVAFYYRSSGTFHYNSLALEKSRKGWYTAVIPGSRLTGKQLQYYAEARDGKEDVTATNGKASSPNVMSLLPASAHRSSK